MNRFFRSLAALLALFVATSSAHATISEEEAYEIGMEAYVYFYPIVTMEITRQMVTNAPLGKVPGFGPMNTISHMRSFPPAEFKSVTRPNFDTLYSSAFIDISNEPMILSAPDTAGRFFMMPLMDMWTDVFATPGKRATGTGGGHWAIVQPGWKGTLPKGVGRIEAPTPTVWLVARVIASGPSDYAIANKIQDGYQLTPLSRWGKPAQAVTPTIDPTVDMKTPPVVKVHNLSAKEFFALGARLMKQHPPHLTDWSQVARLERLGIVVGQDFDLDKAEPAVRAALARVPADGVKAIVDKGNHRLSAEVDHWQMKTEAIGVWGNEYLRRAALAFYGLALQPPADAIYPQAHTDADGQPLGNGNRYVLHFEKGQTPPAAEFWSVTMYGLDTFQIPNAINRFVVHDRDGLKYNADGSLDILIQPERPADESMFNNWLPAPSGGLFTLQARLYTPHRKVLEGLWTMPAVKRVP